MFMPGMRTPSLHPNLPAPAHQTKKANIQHLATTEPEQPSKEEIRTAELEANAEIKFFATVCAVLYAGMGKF